MFYDSWQVRVIGTLEDPLISIFSRHRNGGEEVGGLVRACGLRINLLAFILLMLSLCGTGRTVAAPRDYFSILVEDSGTGRGVPLVELRTVNNVRYYTDSNGIAAIDDPAFMGQKIYFHISSPGYTFPKDGFGYSGVALDVEAGHQAVVKVGRENIAERLYRMTGAGIYSDSILTGHSVPLAHPVLDGQVFGQDTVMVTPYRGKLYWFFGDTDRPSYPLGIFGTSGATSLLPGQGGLDPSNGVDLTYWVDSDGFSRATIPIPSSPGPVWVGGLFTMQDKGAEHLFTHFAEIDRNTQGPAVSGLAEFNDSKGVFEQVCTYPLDNPLHPEGEPFRVVNDGRTWFYCEPQEMGAFPLVRVLPDLAHVVDPTSYEGFTCLAPGTRYSKTNAQIDRSPDGSVVWAWKKNTPALGEDQINDLVTGGKLKQTEILDQLRDVLTDKPVLSHGGSVFWNSYRKRWILITTEAYGSPSFLGEEWYSEADTPVGPWTYARRIATHGGYTFYNPTQLPFFDQDGGRTIYFQGTYTDTYSGVKDITPRYNYNQLMYRLSLSDPRLDLPEPVYICRSQDNRLQYGMRSEVVRDGAAQISAIPFYAVPPGDVHEDSLIPIYESAAGNGPVRLSTTPSTTGATPLFYAMPSVSGNASPAVVPLYEYKDTAGGADWYSTDSSSSHGTRSVLPLCFVWKNPSSVLAFDFGARSPM